MMSTQSPEAPREIDARDAEAHDADEHHSMTALDRARWTLAAVVVGLLLMGLGWILLQPRYGEVQELVLKELSPGESMECASDGLSAKFGAYADRSLVLVQRAEDRFDLIVTSTTPDVAQIVLKNIDVGLMIPALPAWCQREPELARIALADRQWNRQEVRFNAQGPHVEITGGDGFERERLSTVSLVRNCLDDGPWELLLHIEDEGQPAVYYHGWFDFPREHYRRLWVRNTGQGYPDRREFDLADNHGIDPAGTLVDLDKLRQVVAQRSVAAHAELERSGGQPRGSKSGQPQIPDLGGWMKSEWALDDFLVLSGRKLGFDSWGKAYWRDAQFEGAIFREVNSPGQDTPLGELELRFAAESGGAIRFVLGGIDFATLPAADPQDQRPGIALPVGIGAPPFVQDYDELLNSLPQKNAYYSLMVDDQYRWIDHHSAAVAGIRLFRDQSSPRVIHLHLFNNEQVDVVRFRLELDKLAPDSSLMGRAKPARPRH